jgi:hypothetical protein
MSAERLGGRGKGAHPPARAFDVVIGDHILAPMKRTPAGAQTCALGEEEAQVARLVELGVCGPTQGGNVSGSHRWAALEAGPLPQLRLRLSATTIDCSNQTTRSPTSSCGCCSS